MDKRKKAALIALAGGLAAGGAFAGASAMIISASERRRAKRVEKMLREREQRTAKSHAMQSGARGGVFYVSDSGQKVYVKR